MFVDCNISCRISTTVEETLKKFTLPLVIESITSTPIHGILNTLTKDPISSGFIQCFSPSLLRLFLNSWGILRLLQSFIDFWNMFCTPEEFPKILASFQFHIFKSSPVFGNVKEVSNVSRILGVFLNRLKQILIFLKCFIFQTNFPMSFFHSNITFADLIQFSATSTEFTIPQIFLEVFIDSLNISWISDMSCIPGDFLQALSPLRFHFYMLYPVV